MSRIPLGPGTPAPGSIDRGDNRLSGRRPGSLQGVTAEIQPPGTSHAGYRVVMEESAKRVRAVFAGETVADSTGVLIMHETRLRPAI